MPLFSTVIRLSKTVYIFVHGDSNYFNDAWSMHASAAINTRIKPLFHSSQNPIRKLAASAFDYCDPMKVLACKLAFAMSGKEPLGVVYI